MFAYRVNFIDKIFREECSEKGYVSAVSVFDAIAKVKDFYGWDTQVCLRDIHSEEEIDNEKLIR